MNGGRQMARRVIVGGLLLSLVFPAIAAVGVWSMPFMPGCTGGSSGPAAGCYLAGISFNWLVQLATVALLASFFTVPLGLLVALCGVSTLFLHARKERRRTFGIYDGRGNLLSPTEAAAAIDNFGREECNTLLRKFGQSPSAITETLSSMRDRCARVLGVVTQDDASRCKT